MLEVQDTNCDLDTQFEHNTVCGRGKCNKAIEIINGKAIKNY